MNRPFQAQDRRRAPLRMLAVPAGLLVLLCVGAGLLLSRDRDAALQDVVAAQGNMALSLERDIVRNIDIYDLSLRAAAAGVSLMEGTQTIAVKRAILFDGASAAPYFRPIIVADDTGAVRHDAGATEPRFSSVEQRGHFRRHQAEDGLGLLVRFESSNRTTLKPFLSLSRRLDDANGVFAGIVAGGISLDYFQGIFSQFMLPPGGAIALVGYDGLLVAAWPFREDKIGLDVSRSDLVQRAREMENGSFETTSVVDGVARVATVRRLGQLPFFLAIGSPTASVYAEWRVRAWMTGAALVGFAGASCALLMALRRELARRWAAEQSAMAATRLAQKGEQRLQSYLHHLGEGILAIARREDGCFVYERVNTAASRMLYIPAEDMIGRRPREVWPKDVADFIEARWSSTAQACEPVRYERVHERPFGRQTLRFVLTPVAETAADGTRQVNLLLASVSDVTDTLALEAKLRQAQRMEVVGQLTAGVAHDFNNMLQVQFGALELLLAELGDQPEAREYAGLVLGASRHGSRLTHSLLAFSRQQHLAPQVVDVGALLRTVSGMLGHTLGPRIELHVPLQECAGAPFADAAQLESALLNLALNGRDAMPKGGRLTISACDGSAMPSAPDDLDRSAYFVVTVEDEGCGMPPDTVAKACEPFFTTKPVGKGSGLGLAMVQGFVQQSGGVMTITSRPGLGTRVELWLPMAVVPDAPSEAAADPPAETGLRILLVDDSPEVLAITAEMLEGSGFEVVQARHGEEALSLLESERPFDALVTDFSMPGLDGAELVRQAHQALPKLPALVVTGYAEFEGLRDLPPGVRVVCKPLGMDELAGEVHGAIKRGAVAPNQHAPLVSQDAP